MTKSIRNRAIVAYHQANPDATLVEIGQAFPNNGTPLAKQRVWAILRWRACPTCYHSLAFGALCACREKADIIRHNCPDYHRKDKECSLKTS